MQNHLSFINSLDDKKSEFLILENPDEKTEEVL